MKSIIDIVNELKKDWASPKRAVHRGHITTLGFFCLFEDEGAVIPSDYPYQVPNDLKEFWGISNGAKLFIDVEIGWGLKLFSPDRALRETRLAVEDRPDEFLDRELVVGEFLGGSSELLVIDCDEESSQFGRATIADPIDGRDNWKKAANNFLEFLEIYIREQGNNYWEPN